MRENKMSSVLTGIYTGQSSHHAVSSKKNDYDKGKRARESKVKQLSNEPERFTAATSKLQLRNNCVQNTVAACCKRDMSFPEGEKPCRSNREGFQSRLYLILIANVITKILHLLHVKYVLMVIMMLM